MKAKCYLLEEKKNLKIKKSKKIFIQEKSNDFRSAIKQQFSDFETSLKNKKEYFTMTHWQVI
ncbi:hypothetical protein BpHYR1_049067 [Brachionus plicatilis]|uniref:Uncharacterized protein n=1 Tax=Brachionus plicatilis TaxID=10195 RepID=A0A3M7SPP9_BRAPC|nr:hypothetical protein BpHYR1_049067 [Brachionus plicatilis]